jgi:gas vesicle protein
MNDSTKIVRAFLVGVVAGAAIGYFLASDNKEEIIDDLKNTAQKIKDNLEEDIERGKQIVADLKSKVNDLLSS